MDMGTGGSRRCAHDERGQVVVLFALLLPVLFALGAIVLDVGNWYVHKRHLQMQVDAAAFAGATKFVGCSSVVGDPVAANEAVRASALTYAGDTNRVPTPADTFNTQVQEPADVHVVINSNRYWAPGDDTTQGIGLDDTLDADNNPLTPGDPCTTKTLDVKATDHEVPLLWGLLPASPSPKTKARVEIQQVLEQAGMLPWAVPDIEPAAVAALFVDENTGVVTDWQRLCNTSVCMGLPTPDDKLSYWATPALQDPVDLVGENMGVVILVSKENPTPSLTTGAGALTTMCTQSPGLVACHGGDGNQDGLSFIHGWSQLPGGTRASPQIRDVWVRSRTCDDDLSAPYFLRAGDCDLGVEAVIDFGVEGDPSIAQPVGASAVVTLDAPGCRGQGCGMEYVGPAPCCSPTDGLWETPLTSSANVGTAVGRTNFSIEWGTELLDGSSRSGTFGGVAHPYVADERSGPVEYLELTTDEPGVPDANSRNSGPDRSVVVTVGLRKPLQIEDPLAPPMLLRVASPSGSQNQALDCDKAFNFRTEIENGCQTTYRVNYFDWSEPKDGTYEWADILCDAYANGDLPPQEIVNDPPPNCVAIETGDKLGQLRQGLQARFETPDCHANNWPKDQPPEGRGPEDEAAIDAFFAPGGYDFANDPRYVTLIMTDFGTFQSSGSDQVPVKYFAGFYVTGWDRQGNVKPCLDNDPHPWYGDAYRQSLDNGDVWGHFVNLVVFSSTGRGSDELCNFDGIGNCIAVLVE